MAKRSQNDRKTPVDAVLFISSDDREKKAHMERRILWGDDGIPYQVDRTKVLFCQYGKDYKAKKKEEKGEDDHAYHKTTRFTRKVGCTAKIIIKYMTRYEDQHTNPKKKAREATNQRIRELKISGNQTIIVRLPTCNVHTNHKITKEGGTSRRLNGKVKEQLRHLVKQGVTNKVTVRQLLKTFVENEMPLETMPSPTDRAYFPTAKDVSNYVHAALVKGQYSGLDQDNQEEILKECASTQRIMESFCKLCLQDLKIEAEPEEWMFGDEPFVIVKSVIFTRCTTCLRLYHFHCTHPEKISYLDLANIPAYTCPDC